MKNEQLALMNYRLEQAGASLKEAEVLLREKMSFRAVVNRLYYAMFYAVLAVLQEKQLGTSKHIGAISLFDKEFVKAEIFGKELSKILHRAFELRQRGDYMEQIDVTKEDVAEIFPKAKEFVDRIKEYLIKKSQEI